MKSVDVSAPESCDQGRDQVRVDTVQVERRGAEILKHGEGC